MRFEIFQALGHGGQRWYWRLRAANNRIVADGSEGYASKGNCRKAVARVQDAILSAEGELDVVVL